MIAIQSNDLLADGPVPGGQCEACNENFSTDVYRHSGRILCGDCRYVARHNQQPPKESYSIGDFSVFSEIQYRGFGSPELNERFDVIRVDSVKHARLLKQCIEECSMSLD